MCICKDTYCAERGSPVVVVFFISGADKARLMNSYQRIKVVMLLAFIPLCGLGLSFSVTKAGGGTSSSSSSLPPPPPPSHLI